MHCKKCGAKLPAHAAYCSSCGVKTNKQGKKPFSLFRFLLQILSFGLCLTLLVSLSATMLLADARLLTSSGGIETIMSHLMEAEDTPPPSDPGLRQRIPASSSVFSLSQQTQDAEQTLVEQLNDIIEQTLGNGISITTEQMQDLLQNSTMMEFVAEKAASIVKNMLTGHLDTHPIFTTEDIRQLIEENQQIIEDTFQIQLTDENKQEMSEQIDEALADADVNNALQAQIGQILQTTVPGTNIPAQEVLREIQHLAQPAVIAVGVLLCLTLVWLLWLMNGRQPYLGLRWSAGSCMTSGVLLSIPVALVQFAPGLISGVLPETGSTMQVLRGAASVVAPLHYGVLAVGAVLLISAYVVQFFSKKR